MQDRGTVVAVSESVEATQAAAVLLAELLEPGDVIALDGDLGAGKTHFTQGVASGLGVSKPVTSPTFNVMVPYEDGRIPLYHFDLYRLDDPLQLEDIAFYEYVEGEGASCIEWASKFEDELPDDRLDIYLEVLSETSRAIRASAQGERAKRLLGEWQAACSS